MAPVVVVAVTRYFVMCLFLLGCGVELNQSTPGAAGKCEPTTTRVVDFYDNVFSPDIANNSANCVSCHKTGSVYNTAYKFPDPTGLLTDTQKFDLYCQHKRYSTMIYEFPTSSSHEANGGAHVELSSLQNLVNWINSNP